MACRTLHGGVASLTTVNIDGFENVDGGTATSTTVNSGGGQDVIFGGTASGTTINAGGFEHVYSGGTTVATVINGGVLALESGASATGSITFRGAGALLLFPDASVNLISGFSPGEVIDLLGRFR